MGLGQVKKEAPFHRNKKHSLTTSGTVYCITYKMGAQLRAFTCTGIRVVTIFMNLCHENLILLQMSFI